MAAKSYDRDVLAMDDVELEKFVREWVSKKQGYHRVKSYTGSGDRGRDVVGFLTAQLHDGPWHNYQCKQYGRTLPTDTGVREVGKVLYYAHQKEFSAPQQFFFVAPRGINRNLRRLISSPSEFRATLVNEWDKYCKSALIENQEVQLTPELRSFIEAYDFSCIADISLDSILEDTAAKPVLYKWFGADPGPAPGGVVPHDITSEELPYIQQLLDAYAERDGCSYPSYDAVKKQQQRWSHLSMQRERFFDAAAFNRFYRDNTSVKDTSELHREVFHGVADVYDATHTYALDKVQAVMTQAANVQPSGILGRHARVPVKQGLCHQFVNEGTMKWKG